MRKNILRSFIVGITAGLILTFIGIALLALIVKLCDPSKQLISGITVAIKIASVVLAVFLCCRGVGKKGAICGIVCAVMYWVICYVLSSLSAGGFSFDLLVALDLIMTVAAGTFSGIIGVNLIK